MRLPRIPPADSPFLLGCIYRDQIITTTAGVLFFVEKNGPGRALLENNYDLAICLPGEKSHMLHFRIFKKYDLRQLLFACWGKLESRHI